MSYQPSGRRKGGMSRKAMIRKLTNRGRIGQKIHIPNPCPRSTERTQNAMRWSAAFLLKVAMKEAKRWEHRAATGQEL